MLLNLVHLLPDPSGALICPKERLVVFADPCRPGDKATVIGDTVKQVAAVLRHRRPARIVWLGRALPALVDATGAHRADLIRLIDGHAWTWISDEAAPHSLPGVIGPEVKIGGLILRDKPESSSRPGEVNAGLSPQATCDGATHPCYVLDGRRLILPAFGPRADAGTNVMSPQIQSLFRRPFQVLMLAGGRIVTRPRGRLDGAKPVTTGGSAKPVTTGGSAKPVSTGGGGRRMTLFGESGS